MNLQLLPLTVWVQVAYGTTRDRVTDAWMHRNDDQGVDEAVTKMIWLAVGIVVAIAATAFLMSTFETARDNVPDPVAP
jgi:hypothetical protein